MKFKQIKLYAITILSLTILGCANTPYESLVGTPCTHTAGNLSADGYYDQAEGMLKVHLAKTSACIRKLELFDGTKLLQVSFRNDLLFSDNTLHLTYRGTKSIDELGEFIQKYPNADIVIAGHLDSSYSQNKAIQLSTQKANLYKNMLIRAISSYTPYFKGRISSQGYGKKFSNVGEISAKDNRIEIIIEL